MQKMVFLVDKAYEEEDLERLCMGCMLLCVCLSIYVLNARE